MNTHILLITSHYFYSQTVSALKRLNLNCQTTVVPYDDFSHIPAIYRQYESSCDAVMLSGSSARRILELHFPNLDKPVNEFQVDSDALHRDILRFALERKSLDFTRVAIDFMLPMETGYSVADFLQIDDMAAVINQNNTWVSRKQAQDLDPEQIILERLEELWTQNAIDSVICMYSSNIPKLQALGIPFRCPFLSDAHLKRLIKDILIKIELNRLHDNHPAIIQIFPSQKNSMTESDIAALDSAIHKFVHANLMDCVIQSTPSCSMLVTTLQVVRFLTGEFQSCKLCSFLLEQLPFPIAVGYGVGTTVSHAMNNAQIASREAKTLGLPFVVDSNGNLLGPLNSVTNTVITQSSLAKLTDIAGQASLSSMTIQKIMAVLRSRNSDKITIQELSKSLNTTLRNANRIMNNLQNAGFAVPAFTQISHSRGRPVRVYAVNFPTISE